MTTLLAIGDMHLGRLPSALPGELSGRRHELGPEAAWSRAVALAIERKVDGVLLAGDVVERHRDFFVAYGQLKAGVEKLAAAGIEVVAVAGNHDTHVLPRLADEIKKLHLLGAGGHWQQHRLGEATIIGWSFPQPRVNFSPLDSFPRLDPNKTLIGLLHCDRDASDSPYAPVRSADLEEASVNAWLLGHIHQPDALDGARPMGYLGSINALRASETGARGPWLIEVGGGQVMARQLPLAPLRFEILSVDCGDIEHGDQLSGAILAAARERVSELKRGDHLPDALGLRVELVGQCAISEQLPEAARSLLDEARPWNESGIECFIQRIHTRTVPPLDLDGLARQSDPCGLLAQRLLALDEPGSDEFRRLVDQARPAMEALLQGREFRELNRTLNDRDIALELTRAGRLALSQLIAQRERH
jgi:DNA repair protein SbcD/Mre11